MTFAAFWGKLQSTLRPGVRIRNWTAAKGYLGDEFLVEAVSETSVQVEIETAQNLQTIPQRAFEETYGVWGAYCAGKVPRHEIRDRTRFSKYTISIIKHIEG